MSLLIILLSWLLMAAGAFFFISGSFGLLRFPDLFCRLHAVTKADTLGLGFIALGLSLRADNLHQVLMLVLIWVLVMSSGAVTCQLLARYNRCDPAPAREEVRQ